jgi:hypothetical protein
MKDALISGGFILLARKLLESGIMEKPHLFLKLWIYCLLNAAWKDHGNIKRGQFFTSIDRLRDSLSFKIGYRIVRPTVKEIRAAYEFLAKGTMVGITKVTRGMIITIINYDIYQDFLNYERHSEGRDGTSTEGTLKKKEREKERNIKTFSSDSIEIRLAELLLEKIISRNPGFKKPNIQAWAKDIDLMIRIDNRAASEIHQVIEWSQQDKFWQSNILSTSKLKKQFDQLKAKMQSTCAMSQYGKPEPIKPPTRPDPEVFECPRCKKRIIVKNDLTESGCVYCEMEARA